MCFIYKDKFVISHIISYDICFVIIVQEKQKRRIKWH